MENTDISKSTVLVLLVLTLVVSVVGTWTILSQPTTIYKTIELGAPQHGEVRIGIGGPAVSVPQEPASEAGKVNINVLKR